MHEFTEVFTELIAVDMHYFPVDMHYFVQWTCIILCSGHALFSSGHALFCLLVWECMTGCYAAVQNISLGLC